MTDWPSEELWRDQVKRGEASLRALRGAGASPRDIAEASRRVERIWAGGRPEWQAKGRPSRLP